MTTVEPNGCAHCGIPRRGHARQWIEPVGWHEWEPPAAEQIKARMQQHRAARTTQTQQES